jgi:L-seryl-tRNA(Ser) seleniumtransferase
MLQVGQPNRFAARLRAQNPPVIARVEHERVLLDPRTVLVEQEESLLLGIRQALQKE